MARYAIRQVRNRDGSPTHGDWQALEGGSHPDAAKARGFTTAESAFAWAKLRGLNLTFDGCYEVRECPEAVLSWKRPALAETCLLCAGDHPETECPKIEELR